MALLGFTVNMLTLFGLVLAIGIVVDDAIVIVENAAHHIEQGMAPQAGDDQGDERSARADHRHHAGADGVFLPSAFLGGITGQLYRQFALTIAATALISAINAVTLKPAQCALWLRPPKEQKNLFYRGFNRVYGWFEQRLHRRSCACCVRHVALMMLVFVGADRRSPAGGTSGVPTGFLPTEDQGYILVSVQLPDAASQPRTREVMEQDRRDPAKTRRASTTGSRSAACRCSTTAARRTPARCSSRSTPGTTGSTRARRSTRCWRQLCGEVRRRSRRRSSSRSRRRRFAASASAAASRCRSQDRGDVGRDDAAAGRAARSSTPPAASRSLAALNTTFRPGVPQLYVDIDREKVKLLDVPLSDVFATLQASTSARPT